MRQAAKETPRWRRKHPPAGPVIRMDGKQAKKLAREMGRAQAQALAAAPGTALAGQVVPSRVPGSKLAARTGAYRFRLHLVPFWWLAALAGAGLALHKADAVPAALLTALASAAALLMLTRHLSAFARKGAAALAALTVLWLPLVAAFGISKPLPAFLVFCWLAFTIPWVRHYRWRPEVPEQVPPVRHMGDVEIWDQRIAARRLKGTYLTEPAEIPGGRTWTVMLPHGDIVPADVMANEARIAGAWDKPRTEVFTEPYPDGRESRCKITILKRDNLRDVTEWDGSGIDPETGCASIGRYADGQPARIRLFARRDGTRHGLIAGATGSGKTYALDLLIRIALTSGFIVPVVLDPQEGQSLPQWRKRVLYASGVDECMAMLRGLQAGMLDRSRYLSSVTWDDDGHETEGMDFFDPVIAGLPIVLVIGDEFPVLLTDPRHGNEAIRLTADLGKRGRKTGVSLWPVAQVPSLSELGDQVVRSMLVGGNVVCLRTGDRVSAGMLGLDVDPSSLPRYFADGTPTYGLGYVVGPELRQATARTHIVSPAARREVPAVPSLDPRFAAIMARFRPEVQETLEHAAPPPLAAVPDDDAPEGRTASDAILAVLADAGTELERGEIAQRTGRLATGEWGRGKPFGIRAIANALTSLADSGRIDKTRTGVYRLSRPSLHVLAGSATGSTPAS